MQILRNRGEIQLLLFCDCKINGDTTVKYKLATCYSLLGIPLEITDSMLHFHPLEVVDRGSETQLQVGENTILLKILL